MMNKWVEFGAPTLSDSGKTNVWEVLSSNKSGLGEIRWYGKWRKYAFFPLALTIFEQDCLRRIADFCEAESKKLRKQWASRKKK